MLIRVYVYANFTIHINDVMHIIIYNMTQVIDEYSRFLPGDAMRERGLCCHSVTVSVRPSVCHVGGLCLHS